MIPIQANTKTIIPMMTNELSIPKIRERSPKINAPHIDQKFDVNS
jgi:hypothetical protein